MWRVRNDEIINLGSGENTTYSCKPSEEVSPNKNKNPT